MHRDDIQYSLCAVHHQWRKPSTSFTEREGNPCEDPSRLTFRISVNRAKMCCAGEKNMSAEYSIYSFPLLAQQEILNQWRNNDHWSGSSPLYIYFFFSDTHTHTLPQCETLSPQDIYILSLPPFFFASSRLTFCDCTLRIVFFFFII